MSSENAKQSAPKHKTYLDVYFCPQAYIVTAGCCGRLLCPAGKDILCVVMCSVEIVLTSFSIKYLMLLFLSCLLVYP